MASPAQAKNKKSRCFIINQDFPNQDADDPYPLRQEHSRKFITLIQTERRKGYGFVPFIGAGFSAPSGAPLVKELETYLRRCIYMALCRDEPEMPRFQWHPRTDQWPPLADHSGKPSSPDHWWQELLAELSKGLKILSQSERDAFQALRVQGLGAGIDWRTALLFLARLKHGRRGTDEPASLEPPLQEIIDAGLRAVLKEKSPTLEQNMLAVLASELRLDLLLTTNFDDLLERSFAAARNPLQVFEVHLGDSLPHWSALSEVRALVKMHGNRHSLRADYSLDALPTEDEKRRFLEYLLSGQGRSAFATEPTYAPNRLDFQNHLLVMGCSGREKRTLGFIEYAWERLKKDFKVFWLCYGGSDAEQVRSFSNECLEKIESRLADEQNTNDSPAFSDDLVRNPEHHSSIILRHPYNGLLLLEMYQALRRNLPPYSAIFPSVSRIPVPPLPAKRRHEQHLSFATQLQYQLDRFRRNNVAPSEIKLVIASSANTVRGVTTECARVFSQMERSGHVCLWLDMNDISSANNLFEVLLEAAYYKLGIENWIPVYRERDEKRRPREIERLVRSVNKDWVVFLNARETPGANSIDNLDVLSNEGQHGWLSFINPPPDETAEESITAGSFFALLQQLCHRQTTSLVPSRVSAAPGTSAVPSRISVVLMCREPLPVALVNEFEQARLQINRVNSAWANPSTSKSTRSSPPQFFGRTRNAKNRQAAGSSYILSSSCSALVSLQPSGAMPRRSRMNKPRLPPGSRIGWIALKNVG